MGRPEQPQPALGNAIRELRAKRSISQEALAHEADITTSTLSTIERGLSNPTWGTVKGIAQGLGVPLSDLAKLETKLDR
jgi:transcriptional regulator with XRE-family HTH domain